MKRRDFLKLTLYSSTMAGLGLPYHVTHATHGGPHKTLINVMLLGGADFRYLFAPNPDPLLDTNSYHVKYWEARQALYAGHTSYASAWAGLYQATTSTPEFGIHNNAGWLRQQFDLNNVAIICNVSGSTNRRHDQSQLIINTGDLNASQYVYDRDGWGGRLAEAIDVANLDVANVVAMTNDISVFCNGTNSANRNAKVIHARDTRNFALSSGTGVATDWQTRSARALKNYYASKRAETSSKPSNWPYHKFIQHEKALRDVGNSLELLWDDSNNALPAELAGLVLNQPGFAKQCANIYDSFTAADLFKLRVASVEYSGWDTHRAQKNQFEKNISDIFGIGGGLDILTSALTTEVLNNTVFVFTSDFGRQLRANGDAGTDHGSGTYMILVGPAVKGGIYGEMFPKSEISTYDIQGADITGLTSFERVLAETCDWVEPGTGVQVFPNTAKNDLSVYPDGPILEANVDLSSLLNAV